jgi:multicomponent Na+:H+ antiporter subunit B
MNSILFQIAVRWVIPLQLALSIVLLLRGHNEPGGGFIGGLLAASAFLVHGMAHSPEKARCLLRIDPILCMATGLAIAALSGIFAWSASKPFLTGLWSDLSIPTILIGDLKIGSPLLFDIGVYLVVLGIGASLVFDFWEVQD